MNATDRTDPTAIATPLARPLGSLAIGIPLRAVPPPTEATSLSAAGRPEQPTTDSACPGPDKVLRMSGRGHGDGRGRGQPAGAQDAGGAARRLPGPDPRPAVRRHPR